MKNSINLVVNLLAVLIPLFTTSPLWAASESEAQAELKTKHFIDYEDKEEFKKAEKAQNFEVIKLFVEAHDGFPDFLEKPSEHLENAIKNGDLPLVQLYIEKGDIFDGDGIKNNALDAAIRFMNYEEKGCGEEMFKYLLDKGAQYKDPSRHSAYDGFLDKNRKCPGVLKAYLEKFPDYSMGALTSFNSNLLDVVKGDQAKNQAANFLEKHGNDKALIEVLKEANQSLCKKEELKSCRALKEFEETEALFDKALAEAENQSNEIAKWRAHDEEQRDAYQKSLIVERESPEGDFNSVCDSYKQISYLKGLIKNQRKIASQSGVADKVELYKAGSAIVLFEQLIEERSGYYKQKTGKKINPAQCPK